jgi:acyl-coenzyme A synthetase/AMP-(fatty) acid ligase
VAAAVVLKQPVSEKELIAFARERLADYKVPRKLYIVDKIPTTATGKVQRRAVASTFNPQGGARELAPPGPRLEGGVPPSQ